MNRNIFYSSIKNKLIKIGLVQIFLGLSEMINILIIYKLIVYSLESIQNNNSYILIEIGDYLDFNTSLFSLLLFFLCYLTLKFTITIIFTIYKNNTITRITRDISDEIFFFNSE